ncbi:helix-turn-helix transcriptional regulator [Streptomyces griseorubiginosus]|uniref:helix-turn-helix transcriptional regulator n=1 Tax=Streptomyces griseorubiginosus TaxID=67304 RepID=UPI0036C99972
MDPDRRADSGAGLGAFLRSHRERLAPETAGLRGGGRRRVPGLRRDEVAALAGVSTGYYTRLEQGRAISPSPRVLDALARALRLDEEDRLRLHRLARGGAQRTTAPARVQRTVTVLKQLITNWTATPALVFGHTQDLLASNELADALYADFSRTDNALRMLFLDPVAGIFHGNLEQARRRAVANLRQTADELPDDPRLHELVGELSVCSAAFRALWARDYPRLPSYDVQRVRHSAVGELELRREVLAVRGAPGQQLVVLHAEPASRSVDALALLGSLGSGHAGQDGRRHSAF